MTFHHHPVSYYTRPVKHYTMEGVKIGLILVAIVFIASIQIGHPLHQSPIEATMQNAANGWHTLTAKIQRL